MRLNRLLRTTAFRLSLLFAALFLACVLVLFLVIDLYAVGSLQSELRSTVSARIATILAGQADAAAPALAGAVADATEQDPGAYTLLLDAAGHRLAGNLPARAARPGWIALKQPGPGPAGRGDPHAVVAKGVRLPGGGYLLVGQDAFALEEARELIVRAFALGGVLTLLLAVTAGFVVSQSILHRLAAIGRAGQTIMRGDLTRRLPTRGTGDELDQLVGDFNFLLERIGVLVETMRQVTSDIAHDLRTPLTRLRLRLEEVRRRPRNVAEYEAAIDRSVVQIDAILETFAALLRIAQIEAASGSDGMGAVDAAALVAAVVEIYQPLAEERGQVIEGCAEPAVLRGDRGLLIQMLGNLVENACRHTPPGTRIAIGARRSDGAILFWVEDGGPGIPAAAREKVLRPFYRLDASRSTPGNGLGLSLVAAIAGRHGGRVRLGDAGPGLRAEVILQPAEPPG